MSRVSICTSAASAGLLALAGLHAVWAAGSPWPCRDRETLADLAVGREGGDVPPPAACLAVAGLLTAAAGLVSGHPRSRPWLSRTGSRVVIGVLATRGAAGLAASTDLLAPGSASPRFRALDRRYYSPLCLALAALALPAARFRRGGRGQA